MEGGGGCSFIMVLLFPSSKPNSFDMYKQEKEVNKQCAISNVDMSYLVTCHTSIVELHVV